MGDDSRGFTVVGIGASAGGLQALPELMAGLPSRIDVALGVAILHRSPHVEGRIEELVPSCTQLPLRRRRRRAPSRPA